jgi:hypothetical protein
MNENPAHILLIGYDHRLLLAPVLQRSVAFYVILISWGLAFMEYCLAVPANRYGSRVYNPAQLKIGRLNLAKATSSDSLSPSRVSR